MTTSKSLRKQIEKNIVVAWLKCHFCLLVDNKGRVNKTIYFQHLMSLCFRGKIKNESHKPQQIAPRWFNVDERSLQRRDSHENFSSAKLHTVRVEKQFGAPSILRTFCESLQEQQEHYNLFRVKRMATYSDLVQRALSYYLRIHSLNELLCTFYLKSILIRYIEW